MKTNLALFITVIFVLLAFSAWTYVRKHRGIEKAQMAHAVPHELADQSLPSLPATWGYKIAWFAVRSEDPKAVAAALELHDVQSVNWKYGVAQGYGGYGKGEQDYQIFVTPSVHGWVLAMGLPILYEADDHAKVRMIELSKQFGEAQLFGSMRVSSSYIWGRASKGKVVRFFYEGDDTRRIEGDETQEERELNFQFFDAASPEAKQPEYWKRKDLNYPDEENVLKIAGKWSVDPEQLDKMGLGPSLGLLGYPSSSYPPKGN